MQVILITPATRGHRHLSCLQAETSRRGLILINTGPGKGKTTAALGTALRAAGNGMRVLILQFLKGSWHYGELDAIEALGRVLGTPDDPTIVIRQMGGAS
ncbi:cob(I)yrinic acid a,c-diamide adenosyltransferase [Edaphobacter modestus]|uniref:cob(I)yrinic acid a,c-diamide adenosyltransferase n=1 Tax=Edaphobacter modestus TaxID=388466 RepID=UPI0024151231|nr:cob(I)yrinic acid a,c-diamide adenosyltransferase [Edaphobacter modestus]